MKIKVSIIIPVYNVEKYLEECLDSAVNQTLKEIEIIAVNDGSKDSSLDILNKYKKKYENFNVINQENKGLSGARNAGIKMAKGKYVYFLDSDDYIELDSMEICYKEMKKNNLDIITFDAIPFYDVSYTNKLDNETYKKKLHEYYDRTKKLTSEVMNGEDFYIYLNKMKSYHSCIGFNVYKREYIEKNKLYFYEGILHEDEIYAIQSFIKANKVKYLPRKFYNRRIRENSIMTAPISEKRIYGNYIVAEEAYKFIKNHKLKEETISILLDWIRLYYSNCIKLCDILNLYDKRRFIQNEINKKENIINIDLDLQLNCPTLYYP